MRLIKDSLIRDLNNVVYSFENQDLSDVSHVFEENFVSILLRQYCK